MTAAPTIQSFEEFETETTAMLKPSFRSYFGAISWADRKRPRKRLAYLVEDWLTSTGISVVGGRSSSGKSFFALHVCMCVARGIDVFGNSVRRCGVVYQAGEGGLGLLDRMEAYARHFKVPDEERIPFELLPGKLDIFTKEKKDVDHFIEEVNHHSERMLNECGVGAGLITIDTFKKAAPGIDEISGKDNGIVLANVDRIARETGCHVMLVHHTNADGKKLRGHTSLRDDVDQVILIEHDPDTGVRNAILDKIKDGEDNKKIQFTLLAVPVRTDTRSDGTEKEITSCAVVTVSEKEKVRKQQELLGYSPSPSERRLLVNLFAAVDRHGKFVASKADGPEAANGCVVITWDAYRSVAMERMPEVEDRKKAGDLVRNEFKRAKDGLIKYGIIGVQTPFMWWAKKPIRGFARTRNESMAPQPEAPLSPGMQEALDGDQEILL